MSPIITENNRAFTLNSRPEENSGAESTQRELSFERDDGSDSENELKIVLNDEDCKKFPSGDQDVNGVDQKYMRSQRSTFQSNLRVNGSAGITSFSSMSAKSDWEDNGYNQCNGSNAVQAANIHATASLLVPQCAYGFLLPWYRTILDLNIDSFEEKLWRHPGANTSDFFSYHFNEDSWKRYCSLLAYEVGSGLGKVLREATAEDVTRVRSSPKFSDRGEKPLELPKGRAIEVEGSMGERLPSMDVKRPRIQDPNVVIEIKVHDSAEDYSGSGKEKLDLIESNIGDHETSKNGDLEQGFNREVHRCGGDFFLLNLLQILLKKIPEI